ncbi:splicing factor 3B subunit 10-domain-containing protein [Daldinia loculata]|uniref:splicing factor 3B subunit 10-domain-containing protein n=1 Tax=Daldinia loculata TaxID=103429 RepID=UPI0020C53558|nr:splicing factor 3B subunit 10-domain-containing protein [Daldinia loculata]KAI1648880.1 splicing factor 3B subunit 10-domain-containing protein [Daldinia loculata]
MLTTAPRGFVIRFDFIASYHPSSYQGIPRNSLDTYYWADKLRTQQELERLQAKYIGTGHPDTTSWEWRTNVARDTYSSLVGHPSQLAYISLAQNEPAAKVRAQLLRKMIQPCGPPPPREGEEPIRGHN